MAERAKAHTAPQVRILLLPQKRTVVENAKTGFAAGGEAYHKRPWITFGIVMYRRHRIDSLLQGGVEQ